MQKSILIAGISLITLFHNQASAQDAGGTEVQRMQSSAQDFLNRGDYPNAIMMYSQAIRMAPSDVSLRRDLAYAYFLSGDLKKAKEVIDPVVASNVADELTYQVASGVENGLGNPGKARRILNDGIAKFSYSGVLYNAKGNLLMTDKSTKAALEAYSTGIKVEPGYPMNYYNASKIYFQNNNAVWSLLYAEIYLNLDPSSRRTIEMKKMMVDAYRLLFTPDNNDALPTFNAKSGTETEVGSFEEAFKKIMQQGAPAITDGLNTENLIMLRTRFMLAWYNSFSINYPFTLFTLQNKMLHDGVFDAYNQWLFGAADNSAEFSLWLKTNSKEYAAFENWRKQNPLQPASYDPQPNKNIKIKD
ncbi:tetratricopeptide repeat protein [Taibaiella lutea]|uniref:Tetratricopeptide repeat protein n=1 Tax=Taibaiella lutea TaxID=2608001 RepID=A0A5M6CB96_9BACT|nr:tetratricopeptide repeat protein [Taibaiella lutea]KAA5532291.1 tetratricopeptide repeat protein [Taibaiella lutea]